jgi:outer membrane protein TolC
VRRLRALAVAALGALVAAPAAAQRPAPPAGPPAAEPAPARRPAPAARADSAAALTFAEFYRQVLAAHPVARQAALARTQAREELRVARGAFDPSLTAAVDRKTFAGTLYYNYAEAELKIPTPVGSDVKIGYERALGRYISGDRRTGDPLNAAVNPGIFKVGFSVPVGQRLITDERRNALVQARALQTAAEADQNAAVNKLLLDAAKTYARWYEGDRRRGVAREGVALAEFRLRAVRARVARGEAAPIDTVEALLEVQRRQVQRYEAEQAYYGAAVDVANFLWAPGETPSDARPLELAERTVPTLRGLEAEPVDSARLPRWLALAAERHPDVRKVAARVDQAEAQRLFVMQQAIPFAELSLNSVAAQSAFGATPPAGTQYGFNRENVVVGGTLRTPLLFMKERGRFAIADQRLDQQQLERARVRRAVELDVRQSVFDLSTTFAVLELQRMAVQQARQLLVGETRRFEAGESQLLTVNLRERLLLEEELKLASLEAKYASARASLAVSIGEPAVLSAGGTQ